MFRHRVCVACWHMCWQKTARLEDDRICRNSYVAGQAENRIGWAMRRSEDSRCPRLFRLRRHGNARLQAKNEPVSAILADNFIALLCYFGLCAILFHRLNHVPRVSSHIFCRHSGMTLIRRAELEELACEAERAAEAGEEKFVGTTSTRSPEPPQAFL